MDKIPFTSEPGINIDTVVNSVPFQDWLKSMDSGRFVIRSVHIQAVDMFGTRVGFVKFKADVVDKTGKTVSGSVFMRGGSVAILPVLFCKGKRYTVLTMQPRVATGRFDYAEIPAGMLDGSGHFAGVAAKELEEELDLKIKVEELIDLSERAGQARGFFPSPGACDETIRVFAFVKDVSEEELASMNGKCTGHAEENEQITLKIVPLDDLWQIPDGKTIVAYALYERFRA